MSAEDFSERMRERMPAHRTWHQTFSAPTMSRPAQDALWDEMRTRLRVYEEKKRGIVDVSRAQAVRDVFLRPASTRSLVAIVVGGIIMLLGLIGLMSR